MMQTEIGAWTALGVPGEHGNTQPYRADSYVAYESVTMGKLVDYPRDEQGNVTSYDTVGPIPTNGVNATKALGIAVSPHEHVRMVLPSEATSLVVSKGAVVAVASKGTWFVAKPNGAVQGSKLKVANGVLTVDDAGTFAEVLKVDDSVALIRLY